MTRSRASLRHVGFAGSALALLAVSAWAGTAAAQSQGEARARQVSATNARLTKAREAQVLRGRTLVLHHGCGDCHGGIADPAAEGWLAGLTQCRRWSS
jgi:hypothetical protein